MGRRRKYAAVGQFDIPDHESLVTPGMEFGNLREKLERPIHGPGSGRAGGARSGFHRRRHICLVGQVPAELCAICKYGIGLWRLYQNRISENEAWEAYWETDLFGEEKDRFELDVLTMENWLRNFEEANQEEVCDMENRSQNRPAPKPERDMSGVEL